MINSTFFLLENPARNLREQEPLKKKEKRKAGSRGQPVGTPRRRGGPAAAAPRRPTLAGGPHLLIPSAPGPARCRSLRTPRPLAPRHHSHRSPGCIRPNPNGLPPLKPPP